MITKTVKGETMKKKITLSIDSDLYADLDRLPRKVSVSEITTFLLKVFVEETKRGRELTEDEFDAVIKSMGGKEFVERTKAAFGPTFEKIENGVEFIKSLFTIKEKKGKRTK